jgi:hypothetical protein
MSLSAVRNMLNSYLNTYIPLPSIAWENVTFTPNTNTIHVRVNFVPANTEPSARFRTALVKETGFYQLDVYAPQDKGTKDIDTLVEGLRAHFNRGRRLTDANNNIVHIADTPAVSQGMRELGFYRVRITVDWFAYLEQP